MGRCAQKIGDIIRGSVHIEKYRRERGGKHRLLYRLSNYIITCESASNTYANVHCTTVRIRFCHSGVGGAVGEILHV